MKLLKVITTPQTFIVQPYEPGLMIDFRPPPVATDLDRVRRQFELSRLKELSEGELLDVVGCLLDGLDLGNTKDLVEGLMAYSGESSFNLALSASLDKLGIHLSDNSLGASLHALLASLRMLDRPQHFPVTLYCHIPGERTELPENSTTYGIVLGGDNCRVTLKSRGDERTIPLITGSYFSISGGGYVEGKGQVELITRHDWLGMTNIGSTIEDWGRLNYIDGCTDSMLISPPRRGDPCFNSLYFPAGTIQTSHTHPSIRTGLVLSGRGVCKTPTGDHELLPGHIFFLPPETWHSFHTEGDRNSKLESVLTVIAFHPDSDVGPTDEDHAMINRTYFKFEHRLKSFERRVR